MHHHGLTAARKISRFAPVVALAMGLSVGCLSPTDGEELATPARGREIAAVDPVTGEHLTHTALCPEGRFRCLARLVAREGITSHAAPSAYGPADLQSMYSVDATRGDGVTIALVDSYGYAALESDLGVYRKQFGLPACTKANGCLKIVNQAGQTSPLPPPQPGGSTDWVTETALDVDMVSAVCPRCKILVVQSDVDADPIALYVAQNTAVSLGATAISNSWTGQEYDGEDHDDAMFFTHPGVGVFGGTGDWGYDAADLPDLTGPQFPSTSAHVIAVGGTAAVRATNSRGWSETVWTEAGSSCSSLVPKPSYQPADTACAGRAASDVSAVGDPATGLAVYNAAAGGWLEVGGTSAATPIVASLMAAAGHGDVTPGYFYQNPTAFHDVKSGSNGPCKNKLCDAAAGWDGPTGIGTPNQAAIAKTGATVGTPPSIAFSTPQAHATVAPGFAIQASAGRNVVSVRLAIDGVAMDSSSQAPFAFTAPASLAAGTHQLELTASDADGNAASSAIKITVDDSTAAAGSGSDDPTTDPTGDPGMTVDQGGCDAAGGASGLALAVGLALALATQRRKRSALRP